MCVAVLLYVTLGDRHVEIVAHLVDEPHRLAGELAPGAGQRAQVCGDELGAGRVKLGRELARSAARRLAGQRRRIGRRLVLDRLDAARDRR